MPAVQTSEKMAEGSEPESHARERAIGLANRPGRLSGLPSGDWSLDEDSNPGPNA